MSRASDIEAEFPSGVRLPSALLELCEYLDRTGYPISGNMRLRPEGEGLKAWFGAGSAAWQSLAGFGAGPDGSTLALWLYAGADPSQAPVVHLAASSDRHFVLAHDAQEFLLLFGIGYSELGFDDLNQAPDQPESAAALRDWLSARFGLRPPATGRDIVERAQARHPDFAAWVRDAESRRDD